MKSFKQYISEQGRCWKGYKPVKGKKPYSDGSCEEIKEGIIARVVAKGKDALERLDGNPNPNNYINQKRKERQQQNALKKKNEEVDHIEEDWQKVNKQDKTDGMSQKAVNAYRRENPGSKLKTAVTEKNPTVKRASRRASFCARMSGMKRAHASAETKRDPDSPINKALRRWRC